MRPPIAAALTLAFAAPLGAQTETVQTVVERARVYLAEYRQQLTTVIAEEHYEQSVSTPRRGQVSQDPVRRVLESEYLLLRGEAQAPAWAGFRDVVSVDGEALNAGGRLEQLLKSSADLPARASLLARESARYNIGNVVRTINVPTFALEYLMPAHRGQIKVRKAGETTIEGVSTWVVAFEERGSPTIIRHPNGGDVRAQGRWWIVPAAGQVVRTELRVERPVNTRILVTYVHDARLNLWVPRAMEEGYQTFGGHIRGVARYSNYRQFTTSGRLITK